MFLNDPQEVEPELIHEDEKHFSKVVSSFARYNVSSFLELQKKKRDFNSLPDEDKALLPTFEQKLQAVEEAINKNYSLLKQIILIRDKDTLANVC
jgi:carnosine N-methyltransferase